MARAKKNTGHVKAKMSFQHSGRIVEKDAIFAANDPFVAGKEALFVDVAESAVPADAAVVRATVPGEVTSPPPPADTDDADGE